MSELPIEINTLPLLCIVACILKQLLFCSAVLKNFYAVNTKL